MAKKTKNKGVLETLQSGPEYPYGSESDDERDAIKLAKEWILDAKESREYREKLLEALLSFERRNQSNSSAMDAAGESS